MARPKRDGLLYFPFDTDFFFADTKIRILKARYGIDGMMTYIFLLTEIYRNGYYTKWNEDSEDVAIASLGLSEGKIKQIMTFLASRSLINKITLASSDTIITSPGIQKRYQEAVRSLRRTIEVDDRIWLLKNEDTASFIKVTHFEDKYSRNKDKYSKNKDKYSKNPLKESKVKESKVKESKECIVPSASGKDTRTHKHRYGQYQNVLLTDEEYQRLAEKYTSSVRDDAIEFLDIYIAEKGYKSKSHNLAIQRWVIDAVKERKARAKPRAGFNTFEQSDSDLDEIEKLLLEEVNAHG